MFPDNTLQIALLLGKFALGYFAVLAAPGPNMLAVGTLAALRGVRAVLPFIMGVAAGAGALALTIGIAFGHLPDQPAMERTGRIIGAVLLLHTALRIMWTPPLDLGAAREPPRRADAVAFGAGFCTAASNPITAAYFAAQFLGPLSAHALGALAVPLVVVQALLFGLLVATLFARPVMRRLAASYQRLACIASGLALVAFAALLVAPLMRHA